MPIWRRLRRVRRIVDMVDWLWEEGDWEESYWEEQMVKLGLDDTCTLASMRNKRTDNAGFGAPIFRVVLEVWEAINLCFECFILS